MAVVVRNWMSVGAERKGAPGIGIEGQVSLSNHGTRAIFVGDKIAAPSDLEKFSALLVDSQPPGVSRTVLKAVTSDFYPPGFPLSESGLMVEASLPFTGNGDEKLHWTVAGKNSGARVIDPQQIADQRAIIEKIQTDPAYSPRSGEELISFARYANPTLGPILFTQITGKNFSQYQSSLKELYRQAFGDYPYDIVEAIAATCDQNVFVAAYADDKIISVTGAELMTVAGIPIAEIGDSASAKDIRGFGAVMKRYLLQTLLDLGTNSLPYLVFTDSRVSQDCAVLKANRLAGLNLDSRIVLPFHTNISSPARDPGSVKYLTGTDGQLFPVEHMTMTYLDRSGIIGVIEDYGRIPTLQAV